VLTDFSSSVSECGTGEVYLFAEGTAQGAWRRHQRPHPDVCSRKRGRRSSPCRLVRPTPVPLSSGEHFGSLTTSPPSASSFHEGPLNESHGSFLALPLPGASCFCASASTVYMTVGDILSFPRSQQFLRNEANKLFVINGNLTHGLGITAWRLDSSTRSRSLLNAPVAFSIGTF
jgi:hypothetical protein